MITPTLSRKKKKRKKRSSVKSLSVKDIENAGLADKMALSLMDAINAKSKKGEPDRVLLWSKEPDLSAVRSWIPTQFPWFDWMISDGKGLPVGRAIQFWGEYSACKSSFAQALIHPWQATNGVCLYFDFEFGIVPEWLENYHVIQSRFLESNPETIEEAFDTIFESLKESKKAKNVPLLLVWDSVAAALPVVERDEKEFASNSVGVVPRAFSKACRKLPRRLSRRDSTVFFINQTRQKIGASAFEDPKVRPGGEALDFASSTIIRLRRSKLKRKVKGRDVVWGFKVSMKTDKNRLAPPFRQCEIIVDFKKGACPVLSTHHLLKQTGYIVAAGKAGQKMKGYDEKFQVDDWSDFYRENRKAVAKTVRRALASL